MGRDVEEVAAALVREYLSRKGLKKTIACMDEELPRTNSSINNRSELCRALHLESLYKKNKCEDQPLKTMLEIMTKERMKKVGDGKRRPVEGDQREEKSPDHGSDSAFADDVRREKGEKDHAELHTDEMRVSETSTVSSPPRLDGNFNITSPTAGLGSEQKGRGGEGQESRGSRTRRGILAGPIAASSQENTRRRPARKTTASPALLPKNEEEDSAGLNWRSRSCSTDGKSDKQEITASIRQSGQSKRTDRTLRLGAHKNESAPSTRPDALHMAGLVLDDVDDQEVSAGITAVPNNMFSHHRDWNKEPMNQKTATITCVEVQNFDDLKLLIEQHVHQFESGPFGCVLLIVSAVLSRTIPMVREDMDVPTSTLIGAHGYCTQELVNLLLCGRAVSNVFDNEMKLDSGNGNFTLLKGIRERCDIGMLSLFEHYNICKVGSYLKNPKFPIWVVCSESHFSVLFSSCEDLTSSRRSPREFDLHYYDGLANQQEPIRLTVYSNSVVKTPDSEDVDSDLTPPLELCIRTRWTDAAVSWNESEPIL